MIGEHAVLRRSLCATLTDSVIARVAALKTTPTPALKTMWRDLFETEPPPYNRRFLESRLAYRMQELAYGGLKPETIKRLQAIAADLGYLYRILNNRVYIGEAVHKGIAYPGEHAAIIGRPLWDRVHDIIGESPRKRAMRTRAQTPALLRGLIFGPTGRAMTPAHTRKGGKLYRYYVSTDVLKRHGDSCPIRRVPAGEIETAVIDQLRGLLRAPEIVARTWKAARQLGEDISEGEVREALERLDPLWNELFPAEQARIVQLLVERVDVQLDRLNVRLRTAGLTKLVYELREQPGPVNARRAA